MILEGKSGSAELSKTTIAALKVRFPAKNVDNELLKVHLWLLRNISSRPVNIWRFLDNWLRKSPDVIRPPVVVNAWWATDERTVNQGAAMGINARPGESMSQFRSRIADKMRAT